MTTRFTMPTRPDPASGERSGRTRTDAAVEWTVWHAGELVAVGVPVVLALVISWWFVLLAVLAGAAWTAHEFRVRARRRAAGANAAAHAQLAAGQAGQTTGQADDAADGAASGQTSHGTRKGATA